MADYTQGLPYDGWYNGDVSLMIAQGTYADFRDKLVDRVSIGFYDNYKVVDGVVQTKKGEKLLAEWDKEWDSIPVEKRVAARDKVVEYSTPKEVNVITSKGVVRTKKSGPSGDDHNVSVPQKSRNIRKTAAKKGRARGALTKENNPITSPTE